MEPPEAADGRRGGSVGQAPTPTGATKPARALTCPGCGGDIHAVDVLCHHCGYTLVESPTAGQLAKAERLARIRSHYRESQGRGDRLAAFWSDVVRPLLPVVATLVVAAGGWILASKYNAAQLQLQAQQQAASRASAEAGASLSFLEFLARDPAPSQQQQDQATMAVAAVLPPELSFALAVERLPDQERILNLLLRVYGERSWEYVSPFTEEEPTAQHVLSLLHRQNLLQEEFNYLVSDANARPHRRLSALVAYFGSLRGLDANQHPGPHKPATKALVRSFVSRTDVAAATKSDLAVAAALTFVSDPGYEVDWDLLELAASVFWEGIDVSVGTLPLEDGPKHQLYHSRFHSANLTTPAVEVASRALLQKLATLPLQQMTPEEIFRIIYSYALYVPNAAPDPFSPYLRPREALALTSLVFKAMHTPERKRLLSQELGSLSGSILYRNIGQDTGARREYADLVVHWYSLHAREDWFIPKFLHEVAAHYPDLDTEIERIFEAVG